MLHCGLFHFSSRIGPAKSMSLLLLHITSPWHEAISNFDRPLILIPYDSFDVSTPYFELSQFPVSLFLNIIFLTYHLFHFKSEDYFDG